MKGGTGGLRGWSLCLGHHAASQPCPARSRPGPMAAEAVDNGDLHDQPSNEIVCMVSPCIALVQLDTDDQRQNQVSDHITHLLADQP